MIVAPALALEVRLAPAVEQWALEAGLRWDAAAEAAGLSKQLGEGPTDEAHVLACRTELALATLCGLPYPDPSLRPLERLREPDVANVDVRATPYSWGGLLLHDRDLPDDRPHVLVVDLGAGRYRVPGWVYNGEGKLPEHWAPRMPWPCYCVRQEYLRDPSTLPIVRA